MKHEKLLANCVTLFKLLFKVLPIFFSKFTLYYFTVIKLALIKEAVTRIHGQI